MYFVYILYSESISEYYCGQCNDITKRLLRHNFGETRSIKHGCPWKLVGYLLFNTRIEAMRTEKIIKGRGIGRWLSDHQKELIQPG